MSRQVPLSCPGHTRPVVQLHYSDVTSTGYYLISASKDGKPMLRQGETGDWIGTFEGHKGAVWGACLSRGAAKAATGAADFSAKLWDAQSGQEQFSFTHKHIVKAVDFTESGAKLLTGCNDKVIRVFDLKECSNTPQVELSGHTSAIKSSVWNGEDLLISCAEDKDLRLWDTRTGKCENTLQLEHPATSIELSHDRKLLVIANGKQTSFVDPTQYHQDGRLVDLALLAFRGSMLNYIMCLVKSYPMPTETFSASISPDKTTFVAGGDDFKIYKYSYEDGTELESYKGHFGPVHCVRYSPDGEVYCSGSEDGTIRLWLNTVGKSYGLWKSSENGSDPQT